MKTIADEVLAWANCKQLVIAGTIRHIEETLGNSYMFGGDIDNDILNGVESVINELNDKHDLRLDQETIYQKTWEFAANVIRDKYFVNNISGN